MGSDLTPAKQMTWCKPVLLACCLLLGAVRCGGGPVVVVSVSGIGEGTVLLDVEATLDGRPANEGNQKVKNSLSQFVVHLPEGTSGHLKLAITEQDSFDCMGAQGSGETDITGTGHYEVSVMLSPKQGKSCRVVVQRGRFGRGKVMIQPEGMDATTCEEDICEARYYLDTRVTLTAVSVQTPFLGWSGECSGQDACTITIKNEATKVTARWEGAGRAIWGSAANDVWAVGDEGAILRWDGSSWQAVPSGTTSTLISIWGSAANDVWAVGDEGAILRWDGSSWRAVRSGTGSVLFDIWGSAANDVWAVGDDIVSRSLMQNRGRYGYPQG